MNNRKYLIWLTAALVLGGAVAAFATEWTLIVAPARFSVLQALFDVIQRRPAVLVSYQGDATEKQPALHAWNGEEWISISLRDFAEVRFLSQVPTRVLLVGDEQTLPPAVADAAAWCPRIIAVPSLDTAGLLSDVGRALHFTREDWEWFAARYRLQVKDLNAPARATSWYDRPENAPPPPSLPFFRRHRAVTPRSRLIPTEELPLPPAPLSPTPSVAPQPPPLPPAPELPPLRTTAAEQRTATAEAGAPEGEPALGPVPPAPASAPETVPTPPAMEPAPAATAPAPAPAASEAGLK